MKSLWDDNIAQLCGQDALKLRVYSSRLLGKESSLVLHGGGNTSVKAIIKDFFGEPQEVLYIKASGWDLATIEPQGFAPVKLEALKRMASFNQMTDSQMVEGQRLAMLNPYSPNPSVEAILHAIIPYTFVDHTHADAIATITNTPKGASLIKEIYGNRLLIVPYVMPGFVLAKKIYEMTQNLDWSKYEGMVLLNHGLFTFADTAKESYENHLRLVTEAEKFISKKKIKLAVGKSNSIDLMNLAILRKSVSEQMGKAVVAKLSNDRLSIGFSNLSNVKSIATRGTLTPDHVIRTKPIPVVIGKDPAKDVRAFAGNYKFYFECNTNDKLKILDPAPRWAVWPGQGVVSFGTSIKEANIVADIVEHTIAAIQLAEGLGGWKVLSEKDIFEMEYWELEQAKLASSVKALAFQGKIALVTGAASGIGRATVEYLTSHGASVIALDINKEVVDIFNKPNAKGLICDVTKDKDLKNSIDEAVRIFGGLDIIVSNAGIFTSSENIAGMSPENWEKSLRINLTSHQQLIKFAIPYLEQGIDPSIIIVGSKNVPAPGPGAGAYSVAKAGLTQLARVTALELAGLGIRVNVIHPNQVFDTAIWTKDVLEKRAKAYGLSVEDYKKNNLLKTEITSHDVANLIGALAGKPFAKTTGAQIPIDGGNDRVI